MCWSWDVPFAHSGWGSNKEWSMGGSVVLAFLSSLIFLAGTAPYALLTGWVHTHFWSVQEGCCHCFLVCSVLSTSKSPAATLRHPPSALTLINGALNESIRTIIHCSSTVKLLLWRLFYAKVTHVKIFSFGYQILSLTLHSIDKSLI